MSNIIDGQITKSIEVSDIKFPISYRPDTTDTILLNSIFLNNQYKIPFEINPKFIIDGGGNVGFTAVYFANKYPDATIISIEPESSNYKILKHNTSFYKNIKTIQSALWNDDAEVKVVDIGHREWGFIVEPCVKEVEDTIRAITISSILKNSGFNEIDILKLDIEGSEREVFSSNYDQWLSKVKILIIEIHDDMKIGSKENVFNAISQYNFEMSSLGENLIFIRK